MKVDVYKRPDGAGLFSYLVIPHEKMLPDEVTNTDWQIHEQNVDFERDGKRHFTLQAEDAFMQIGEKGYAITHLAERSGDGAS
ncbi:MULTISPECIES: DUF6139 family protein [Herbaspirillum]|uniref:DUF6139 family protein n=1 Tax=Herbaspirillum TaxID=963 RepID=UPI00059E10D5|nr:MULTISPECIES: DUF6139 family protein [Herbaspirillum]AKN66131.1 hypothetical protein ACP92_13415 [Herbaspirillum seropedicae]AON55013.1 hypothetical protein Hsc_2731 [Herbaspirillum seropedicae]MDR6393933.1 hypothetical protein [Herbaspirillum seropedicae]NQE30781.1 hypothetical protein [Herbaspirillum seropedicae]QDD65074.1 hypothetical protein EJD96_13345 [Herbaspirillum seropedicae]